MLGRRRGPLGGGGACTALVAPAARLVACATTIPSVVAGRPSGCCAHAATGSEIAIIVMSSRFMVPPIAPAPLRTWRGAANSRIDPAEPLRQARAVRLAHFGHHAG